MHIVETIGKWGVKTSEANFSRYKNPKPGDVVKFQNNSFGRIYKVDRNKVIICEDSCSVFLNDDGSVSISGGPFLTLPISELEPLYELMVVRFWNWGDHFAGKEQGVNYYLERPIFVIKNEQKYKVGDKIEVPSYLGGSFTAIITKVTPHGVQAKIAEGYGDFSGKINFYEFNEIERA